MKVLHDADVQRWEEIGEPQVLAQEFGAHLKLQQFKNPHTGEPADYSLFGGKDWSIVCPITPEGNLILVEQYKQGANDIVLEFPAGAAESGEALLHTAARELEEETGFRAKEVRELGTIFMSSRKSRTKFMACAAINCRAVGQRNLDPDEVIRVLEATPSEFWSAVREGKIVETSTINAATLAALKNIIPFVPA